MMEREYVAEICCGSFYDAKQAALGGASRIELNSALMLGGLTPTASTLCLVKGQFPKLKVIAMVRPRGAELLLQNGADGIAFGCLKEDGSLDRGRNQRMVEIIKSFGKEAVFHRAFDCCDDPFGAMGQLIRMEVDRVLTSGLKPTAPEGAKLIGQLQGRFGDKIEILAGSGVNMGNACELMEKTGVCQVHSSCKDWRTDPTTVHGCVSYSMASGGRECQYDVVSEQLVRGLVNKVEEFGRKR